MYARELQVDDTGECLYNYCIFCYIKWVSSASSAFNNRCRSFSSFTKIQRPIISFSRKTINKSSSTICTLSNIKPCYYEEDYLLRRQVCRNAIRDLKSCFPLLGIADTNYIISDDIEPVYVSIIDVQFIRFFGGSGTYHISHIVLWAYQIFSN